VTAVTSSSRKRPAKVTKPKTTTSKPSLIITTSQIPVMSTGQFQAISPGSNRKPKGSRCASPQSPLSVTTNQGSPRMPGSPQFPSPPATFNNRTPSGTSLPVRALFSLWGTHKCCTLVVESSSAWCLFCLFILL
jgi:hypothetical protein